MKKPLSFYAHYNLVPGAKMVKMRRFHELSSGILHKFSNFFVNFAQKFPEIPTGTPRTALYGSYG